MKKLFFLSLLSCFFFVSCKHAVSSTIAINNENSAKDIQGVDASKYGVKKPLFGQDIMIKDHGNGVYTFYCAWQDFGSALSQFLSADTSRHIASVCITNGVASVGFYVILKTPDHRVNEK